MKRREILKSVPAGAIALAASRIASAAADTKTLHFVPQADLASLETVFTAAYVTRNHAFLVFDTLYGIDASLNTQPQMLAGDTVANDGKLWTLTLRDAFGSSLLPPFDKPAIKHALLGAVNQADFMQVVIGDDAKMWRDKVGVFTPDTPLATEAGIEVFASPRDSHLRTHDLRPSKSVKVQVSICQDTIKFCLVCDSL